MVVAAVYQRDIPGLAVLAFFALAFVCWDAGFLLRRVWHMLQTPSPPAEVAADMTGLPSDHVAGEPLPPVHAWAVREGVWIAVTMEPEPSAKLAEVLDVVIEAFDGRPVLCPAGERPPVPLEFLGRHAILCRFEDGTTLRVSPLD